MGEPNQPELYEKDSGVKEVSESVEKELARRDPKAVTRGPKGLVIMSLADQPDLFEKMKNALREADSKAERHIPTLKVKVGDWVNSNGDWCQVSHVSPWENGVIYLDHRTESAGGYWSGPVNGEGLEPATPPPEEFHRQALAEKHCKEYKHAFAEAHENALKDLDASRRLGDKVKERLAKFRAMSLERAREIKQAFKDKNAEPVYYKGRVIWEPGDEPTPEELRARFDAVDKEAREPHSEMVEAWIGEILELMITIHAMRGIPRESCGLSRGERDNYDDEAQGCISAIDILRALALPPNITPAGVRSAALHALVQRGARRFGGQELSRGIVYASNFVVGLGHMQWNIYHPRRGAEPKGR